MTATTLARNTTLKEGHLLEIPVAAATKIPAGVMVQVNASGFAVNAAATVANRMAGIAVATADNSVGAAGDITVTVRRGIAGEFANSASGDLIAAADRLNNCYVVDNQTVAKTDGSSSRPAAGKILDVTAAGVLVLFT